MLRKIFSGNEDLGSVVRKLQEEWAGKIDKDTGRRQSYSNDYHIKADFIILPFIETLYRDDVEKKYSQKYRFLINVFRCGRVFPNRAVKGREVDVKDDYFQDQVIIGNDVLLHRIFMNISHTYDCTCRVKECYIRPFSEGTNNTTLRRVAEGFIEGVFTNPFPMSFYYDRSIGSIKEIQLIIPEECDEWDISLDYGFVKPRLERLGYRKLEE
ncbi:hypothetical protein HYT56_04715 [Candidatus Woesearchaeota archaeon]|nr:hypothetical protein [Candidatus Woesearchaeota archaeon]